MLRRYRPFTTVQDLVEKTGLAENGPISLVTRDGARERVNRPTVKRSNQQVHLVDEANKRSFGCGTQVVKP